MRPVEETSRTRRRRPRKEPTDNFRDPPPQRRCAWCRNQSPASFLMVTTLYYAGTTMVSDENFAVGASSSMFGTAPGKLEAAHLRRPECRSVLVAGRKAPHLPVDARRPIVRSAIHHERRWFQRPSGFDRQGRHDV